ncbi:glutamate--cysteine ligase, chloroplastic [Tanacetum coccineum]
MSQTSPSDIRTEILQCKNGTNALYSRSSNTNSSRTSFVAFPRDPSKNTQTMHVDAIGAKSKRGIHVIVATSPPTEDDAMERFDWEKIMEGDNIIGLKQFVVHGRKLTGKGVTTDKTRSTNVEDGVLYLLEKTFFFLPKPPTLILHDEIRYDNEKDLCEYVFPDLVDMCMISIPCYRKKDFAVAVDGILEQGDDYISTSGEALIKGFMMKFLQEHVCFVIIK